MVICYVIVFSMVTCVAFAFSALTLLVGHQEKHTHTHTHPFNGPFPGLPRWAGTRKVTPIWILLKQETVSGSDISWAIFKSVPRSRQITMPTPHHSVFYRPDALPAAQPTASKHWRNQEKHTACTNEWWGIGGVSVWSEVQIVCIWSRWCHCIPKPHRLLPHFNPDWFYLSGTGLHRLSWKRGR